MPPEGAGCLLAAVPQSSSGPLSMREGMPDRRGCDPMCTEGDSPSVLHRRHPCARLRTSVPTCST